MTDRHPGILRFQFGDNPALIEELTALVIAGTKTATCANAEQARANGWVMTPGQLSIAQHADEPALKIVLAGTGRTAVVMPPRRGYSTPRSHGLT